jgi:hypothetical protein
MWLLNYGVHEIFGVAGYRPGSRVTFLSGKVTKANGRPTWPHQIGRTPVMDEGAPTRSAQTRSASLYERPPMGARWQASDTRGCVRGLSHKKMTQLIFSTDYSWHSLALPG